MKNIAIIIVVFNISNLIDKQLELIKRFCKDDQFEIIIIDNSINQPIISNQIQIITNHHNCQYIKTATNSADFSQSHAGACNYAYNLFKEYYEYMFFLDHDNFPLTDFSVREMLSDKIIAGLGQLRPAKKYFWPGCVMFNNKNIEKDLINFSISQELGLDTGGMLYKIIEKYGEDNCIFFDEYSIKNTAFNGNAYNEYNKITGKSFSFMHFVNASNWNKVNNNDIRITSLLKILEDFVKEIK